MYYLFRLATFVIPRLPRRLLYALSPYIAFIAWLLARNARKQATTNMMHVLGSQALTTREGRRQLRRTVRGMFRSSVCNYFDAFLLPHTRTQEVRHNVYIEGLEHLEEALALGKGVILFSAHFGPFEYIAQWFVAHDYATVIPVEHLKDERILNLVVKLRSSMGIKFVPLGGSTAMRTIFTALRNNQVVLITADRAIHGESIEKPFFGAPARLPLGPVQLSQRTGAPLVGGLGWRTSNTRMVGEFMPLSLALPESERKNTDVLMDMLIKHLERLIRAHPEQWVVFSPVWQNQEITSRGASS